MRNIFTQHPNSINEGYFQHMKFAGLFGFHMVIGGFACLIHAIFPFLFEKTGSNLLLKQTQEFIERMPVVEERVQLISCLIDKKNQRL